MHAVDAPHLGDRVGHRRLHPDAEHVELEQAELLDVVLVELAHREPGVGRLDGCAVEQRDVGEQHPAGMHRDVARQPVEPLDQSEEAVERAVAEPAGPQLGQVAQRRAGVAGTDVGERLGDRVDLPRRHAEGGADVADRVADAVGVHHRDGDAPLAAEAVEDRAVDLLAPGGLHVDVDVGQRGTQRRQEPLHQQAVADRVDPGDAEQVVDQAAGAGPAGGTTDAHLADQVGDVGDGQEVGRVAQGPDRLELVVEPLPDPHPRAGAVAPADRRLAAGAQQRVGRAVRARVGELELREVHLADAEVGARVERAPVGDRPRAGEQPPRLLLAVARARRGGRSPRPPRASACRS